MNSAQRRFPWGARSPWPAVSLIGGAVVLWWLLRWALPGERIDPYVNLDALTYWVPLLREAATQWRAGTAPLWNPYQALGGPLLATEQVGAAYPLNALYLLLDPGWAWLLTGVLHHLIAGLGMYGFCRAVAIPRPAALVGGATYAFSALVLGKYIDQPEFICLAWLPVLFACAEQLMIAPDVTRTIALALVWALEILGGHPETFTQSALLLGAYVSVRVLTDRRSMATAAVPRLGACLSAAVAALALTAFQWLPTLELLGHSVRAIGALSTAQQAVLAADASRIASGTVGPLALALVGFWLWPRRLLAWFFGTAALLLFLLALGPTTALFDLFRRLPTGTWFRAPVRFLNLWPLCIAMLAAAGAAELQTALIAHDSRRWLGVTTTTIIVVAIVRIALRGARLLSHVGLVIIVFDLLPLVAGGVACIAVTRKRRAGAPSPAWQFAPGIAFAVACAAPGFPFERFASPLQIAELYGRQNALFAPLRAAPPARVLSLLPFRGHGPWAKLGTYFEVPVLNDVEPLSLVDFRAYADALRGGMPADVAGLPTVFMGEVAPPRDRYDTRLLNLAGVRFVVTDDAGVADVARWFSAEVKLSAWARSGDQIVYENRAAFPRAFFVPSEATRGATANCLDVLRSPGFDPVTAVLLEESATSAHSGEPRGTASVTIRAYTPSEVRLASASDASGFVVLTDAFYPGWTATIDGTKAPILRADCFFRAVRVTAGKHDITFRYTPRSFRFGSIVSGGAFIAIVLTGIAQRRRPRP